MLRQSCLRDPEVAKRTLRQNRRGSRRSTWALMWLLVMVLSTAVPVHTFAAERVLTVAVTRFPMGILLTLSSSSPFQFSIRQSAAPLRLVIDARGLQPSKPGKTTAVNVPPVTRVRLAQGAGFAQVVVELSQAASIETGTLGGGRKLLLRLRPAGTLSPMNGRRPGAGTVGPPTVGADLQSLPIAVAQAFEVVRLQFLKARDVAVHLQRLFPGLTVRVDEPSNSVLLNGTPEQVAQAKQVIAALDAPPATAPVTEVVPLKVLKPEVLAPVLAAMFPEAKIRAEPALNAIVIVASKLVATQIKTVVATLDVPPAPSPTDPTTEVLRLQHADPVKTAALLAAVLPGARLRVDPGTRTITITAPPAVVAQAKTLLQQLDLPSATERVSEVVKVRGDPEALAMVLRQTVPGITIVADRAVSALVLQGTRADIERAKAALAGLEPPGAAPPPQQLQVIVIPLKHVMPSEFATEPATSRTAEEVAQAVTQALQPIYPELRITVDKRTQALILTGSEQAIAAGKDLIAKLDVPSPQVALEVRVVEVAQNALKNMGISLSPIIGTTYSEPDPNTRPLIFGRTPLNISLILNLLAEQGQAKILANPTVATIDGRKALIRTGDDIPLIVRQIFGSTVLETLVTFRAGVTLEIIPKISPEGIITCILKPVVSTITGVTPQGTPQISVREVQTTLSVKNGDSIVIGGLLEERDLVTISKIPGLGDLPFLGRLFRSERREHRRTELVITVTPHLLPLAGGSPPPAQQP